METLRLRSHRLGAPSLAGGRVAFVFRAIGGRMIGDFLAGMETICRTIDQSAIERCIDVLFDAWKRDAQIFLIGNGGSAGTATHFACDLNKCTISPGKRRMRVHALVDNIPLVSALTNDE